MSGRKILIAVSAFLAVVAVAGGAAFFLLRGAGFGPFKPPPPPPPPPDASFQALEVRASDAAERPEAGQVATDSSQKVIALLNDYYTLAFLRPQRWTPDPSPSPGEKTIEETITEYFLPETQASIAERIGALSLAELGGRFERVNPVRQEAQVISFHIEHDLSAPVAVATIYFEGSGTTKDKKEGPVTIVHTATYWMLAVGDTYRILGYEVEFKADTVKETAAFGLVGSQGAS